jgi:hypothetical protein
VLGEQVERRSDQRVAEVAMVIRLSLSPRDVNDDNFLLALPASGCYSM